MINDLTECLAFVERIIPAILPALVRKCSAPSFRKLLLSAEENCDEMFLDFGSLGLTLEAVDVQIKRLDSSHYSCYFLLVMDGEMQRNCAGYHGSLDEILRFLRQDAGVNRTVGLLKEAVSEHFREAERHGILIQVDRKKRTPMKRILFVCTGNMYRSAGAEFILRRKLSQAGVNDWAVDSAGTLELWRATRPEDFGRVLAEHGYDFGGVTRYVYDADPAGADLILVMEPQHLYDLRCLVPENEWGKIHLFMEYCFDSKAILTDPSSYFSEDLYRETRDKLEQGCDKIVERILNGQL